MSRLRPKFQFELSRIPGAVNSLGLVVLLFGSLFQDNVTGGINPILLALPIVGTSIAVQYLRNPLWIPPEWILAALLALFVYADSRYHEPLIPYGQDKLSRFLTLTVFTVGAASCIRSIAQLRSLLFWWVSCGVVLAVFTLTTPAALNGRASAFDANPVWLARALSSSIVITSWLWSTRKLPRALAVPVLALLVVGLFASGSRGPLLAAVIGSIIAAVVGRPQESSKRITIIAFALPLVLVAMQWIPSLASNRIYLTISGDDPNEVRSSLWAASANVIVHHPSGVGIGNWSVYSGYYDHLWPHNLGLEIFAEFGWVPGVVFTLGMAALLVALWRRRRDSEAASVALVLVIVESVHVSTSGDLNARTFFFVIALAVGLLRRDPRGSARVRIDDAVVVGSSAERFRRGLGNVSASA